MKSELQKMLEIFHETAVVSLDHLADRIESSAGSKLGDEHDHLAEFVRQWTKLSKASRKLFVEQLLRSAMLVLASSVATKAGLRAAGKSRKRLRKGLLSVADFVDSGHLEVVKKVKKEGKKAARKTKKK